MGLGVRLCHAAAGFGVGWEWNIAGRRETTTEAGIGSIWSNFLTSNGAYYGRFHTWVPVIDLHPSWEELEIECQGPVVISEYVPVRQALCLTLNDQ